MKSKQQKRTEAEARQVAYGRLSVTEKIACLDARFGNGKGAARQRKRLTKEKA